MSSPHRLLTVTLKGHPPTGTQHLLVCGRCLHSQNPQENTFQTTECMVSSDHQRETWMYDTEFERQIERNVEKFLSLWLKEKRIIDWKWGTDEQHPPAHPA